MRRLCSAESKQNLDVLRKHLFRAGIRCEIRHEVFRSLWQDDCPSPEVWVCDDRDFIPASKLVRRWLTGDEGSLGKVEEHAEVSA